MNVKKLKLAEQIFMQRYPGGFAHPEMIAIGKKHKMDRLISRARENFAKKNFREPELVLQEWVKFTGASSMVSVFEKPKFRDFVRSLEPRQRNELAAGLKDQLHGDEEKGFNRILHVMFTGKIAKWALISAVPVYFRPQEEVFVKPTTAKGVIASFELENLHYRPQPSWEFYSEFRRAINDMKSRVDSSLSPNSAAFTGFLMMSMNSLQA